MKWRKLGRVFAPNGERDWMASHAACPVPHQIGEHLFHIYFTPRDEFNRSVIARLSIDIREPLKPFDLVEQPMLVPGPRGAFDDNGVSMGCILRVDDTLRLYYMGWTMPEESLWTNNIGLCVSKGEGQGFQRYSANAILQRTRDDPQSMTYPWIHRDESGWRMWYGSHVEVVERREDIRHVLKMARSVDGINWTTTGDTIIDLVGSDFAVTKPCVIRDRDKWRMWFSRCRADRYRLGYAESLDGETWQCSDDEAGIQPSEGSWDSHSVEYGSVFDCDKSRYMLYNGREYGRTGFGLAILEQD
jgi:hypothetical protein